MWVVAALAVLEAHEGPQVQEKFEDFEGVEDFVEPVDLEFLVWQAGPEDLHWQLFLFYEYILSCLIIIQYVFSLSSLHLVTIIRISFFLVLRSQMSPHVM